MIRSHLLCLAVLALVAATDASAQKATEVYIPIGESPGVSGSESVMGSVSSIAYEHHRMTITTSGEARSVTLTDKTLYYIDSSGKKKRNRVGSVEDCEVGDRVEAYVDETGEAVWVKILVR